MSIILDESVFIYFSSINKCDKWIKCVLITGGTHKYRLVLFWAVPKIGGIWQNTFKYFIIKAVAMICSCSTGWLHPEADPV